MDTKHTDDCAINELHDVCDCGASRRPSLPSAQPSEKCVACGGNDMDAPCAYPRKDEAQEGCLRNKRLAQPSDVVERVLSMVDALLLQGGDYPIKANRNEMPAIKAALLSVSTQAEDEHMESCQCCQAFLKMEKERDMYKALHDGATLGGELLFKAALTTHQATIAEKGEK